MLESVESNFIISPIHDATIILLLTDFVRKIRACLYRTDIFLGHEVASMSFYPAWLKTVYQEFDKYQENQTCTA
jgi:hypothetical protein